MLIEVTICPFCGGGARTPCFARYTDGYHCFSCGTTKKSKREFRPREEKPKTVVGLVYPNAIPMSLLAKQFLIKSHITSSIINQFNIYQCDNFHLIYPFKEFYQKRNFVEKRVKNFGKPVLQITHHQARPGSIILVEDPLSYYRVAQHISCGCQFGTAISKENLKSLITHYDQIILWYDPDKAGQEAAIKTTTLFNKIKVNERGYKNTSILSMKTGHDPKYYNSKQMLDLLGEYI